MKRKTHPVVDKAEVSIDFPDKFYMGSFARGSTFEAKSEDDGLFIRLTRPGDDKRTAEFHLHHHLLADILAEWAKSLSESEPMEKTHRETLLDPLTKVDAQLQRKD